MIEPLSYLRALLKHWWALLSSAVFTGIGVYALLEGKSPEWTAWTTICAGTVLFFVAGFLAWRDEHHRATKAESEVERIAQSRPKLLLKESDSVYVENVSLQRRGIVIATVPFVKVRFINSPDGCFPTSVAKNVRAKIKFYSANSLLLEMDGRWADSDQRPYETLDCPDKTCS
jgi:hypothetical protein